MTIVHEAEARTVIADVGRCIYCGQTGIPLSEEHAVPFALNGSWVLLNASCGDCREITSLFERAVLRYALLQPRVALGVKTRHRKKRPDTFPLDVLVDGVLMTVQVSAVERPVLLCLPIFAVPAHLSDAPYEVDRMKTLGVHVDQIAGVTFRELDARYGKDRWHFRIEYDLFSLARMLAKIAYSMAVGAYGYDAFAERYVVPAIRGQSNDLGRWVGSTSEPPLNNAEGLHAIGFELVGDDLLSHVRLMMQFDGPEYVVVVGRLDPSVADRVRRGG